MVAVARMMMRHVTIAIAVMRMEAIVMVPMIAVRTGGVLIGRIRCERARAGIGRSRIDVVILRRRLNRVVLRLRVGQPVIGPSAAGAAAGVGVGAGRAAAIATGHRGRGARGRQGKCRNEPRNHLTHYSLLSISYRWFSF